MQITSLHGRRAGIAEDNRIVGSGVPYKVTASVAAGASNITVATLTVTDVEGKAVAACHMLDLLLSDAATGADVTGTTASGNVEADTNGGVVLETVTAKKHLRVQTNASGVFKLKITDTDKHPYVICAAGSAMPFHVVTTLATASYGA